MNCKKNSVKLCKAGITSGSGVPVNPPSGGITHYFQENGDTYTWNGTVWTLLSGGGPVPDELLVDGLTTFELPADQIRTMRVADFGGNVAYDAAGLTSIVEGGNLTGYSRVANSVGTNVEHIFDLNDGAGVGVTGTLRSAPAAASFRHRAAGPLYTVTSQGAYNAFQGLGQQSVLTAIGGENYVATDAQVAMTSGVIIREAVGKISGGTTAYRRQTFATPTAIQHNQAFDVAPDAAESLGLHGAWAAGLPDIYRWGLGTDDFNLGFQADQDKALNTVRLFLRTEQVDPSAADVGLLGEFRVTPSGLFFHNGADWQLCTSVPAP